MTWPYYASDSAAVLPGALSALVDLRGRGLDHTHVRHVRSSQAFALNLFAPLTNEAVRAVLSSMGVDADEVERPVFEFEDLSDRLGETSKRNAHRTQVDVALRATDTRGRRVVVLIEVKFTETDFGHCTAFANPANAALDVCRSNGIFGGEPQRCFQLLNHGHGQREYARYLAPQTVAEPTGPSHPGGCYVRDGRNQPMRNIALAHMLLAEGEADLTVYALCAPLGHKTMWRRFGEVEALFPNTKEFTTKRLPAEDVARVHPDGGRSIQAKYPQPALDIDLSAPCSRTIEEHQQP